MEQIGSADPAVVERALYDLSGTIYHQGWVYPATVPAVAVLYEFVSAPGTHHRPRILGLLSDIATAIWDLEDHGDTEYDKPDLATIRRWARAARAAVETGVPALLSLLDDVDPAARAAAGWGCAVLGWRCFRDRPQGPGAVGGRLALLGGGLVVGF